PPRRTSSLPCRSPFTMLSVVTPGMLRRAARPSSACLQPTPGTEDGSDGSALSDSLAQGDGAARKWGVAGCVGRRASWAGRQTGRRPTLAPGMGDITRGVLDNLQLLEEAQKISRWADHYRCTGQVELACQCYEAVHRLCPGSRYDHEALNQLQRLQAPRTVDE